MDVRCEKCLTVYDFDDTQIGSGGVNVKCTQCGNLFKVRRRSDTAEMPIAVSVARAPTSAPGNNNGNNNGANNEPEVTARGSRPRPGVVRPGSGPHTMGSGPVAAPPPSPSPAANPPVPRNDAAGQWMMRLASNGEVFRFREMTTLQQWIVERKVVRDDEISRDGVTWKALGGIPELDPFFRTVAQAMAAEQRSSLPVSDWENEEMPSARPAAAAPRRPLSTMSSGPGTGPVPMPMGSRGRGSGPSSMGGPGEDDEAHHDDGPDAYAHTSPKPKLPPVVDELANQDLDEEIDSPVRRPRWPLIVAPIVVVLGVGIWLVASGKLSKHDPATKGGKYLADARQKLLLDTDDGFRDAAALFTQARGADEASSAPLAGLAETATRWAFYLREDARSLEGGGTAGANQSIAQSLRRQAQGQLDNAKKLAADALSLSPESADVNLAMGEYLRVDGAPAAEVERYLRRAADHAAGDPDTAYALGALSFRDGKSEEARQRLEQANTLAQGQSHELHVAASYLLAKMAVSSGRRADAQKLVDGILKQSPQHDRARALLAGLPAAVAPTATPDLGTHVAGVIPPAPGTLPPAPGTAPATPSGALPGTPPSAGGDYAKLVTQADKLIENGRTDQARKLYDKALAANPSGLEAITGIGYCDLDRERYMAAIDHFKQALGISSEYGEALIGLAEAYKVQGNKAQAVEFYKRYLKSSPGGEKAAMAQKNVKELETKLLSAPKPEDKPAELPKAPEAPKIEPKAEVPKEAPKETPKEVKEPEKKAEEKPPSDAPPP